MENELRSQFRQNWSNLKEELSPRWKTIADASLEKSILDFEDLERIQSLDIDSDRIEAILLKVIKLRKCEVFFQILEAKGFGRLCNDVRNTDVEIEESEKSLSTVTDFPKSLNSKSNDVVNQKLHDLKEDFQARDRQLTDQLNQRDEALKSIEEQLRHIDKKLSDAATENKLANKLYEDCLEWKKKYEDLQSSQQQTRDRINELTKMAQRKNLENSQLMKQVSKLKRRISELEKQQFLSENRDADKVMIQNQKETLDQLEIAYNEKVQEVASLNKELESQITAKQTNEQELRTVKESFELLRIEKENIQKQKDHDEADKANAIMTRLEQLIQEHEPMAFGITGRAPYPSFKGKAPCGRR